MKVYPFELKYHEIPSDMKDLSKEELALMINAYYSGIDPGDLQSLFNFFCTTDIRSLFPLWALGKCRACGRIKEIHFPPIEEFKKMRREEIPCPYCTHVELEGCGCPNFICEDALEKSNLEKEAANKNKKWWR